MSFRPSTNTYWKSRWREEREKGAEIKSDEIIAKKFPNLILKNYESKEAKTTSIWTSPEIPTQTHIVIKWQKYKVKKRILKAAREK